MMINIEELRSHLCHAFCQDIYIVDRGNGEIKVSLPVSARDGDLVMAYVSRSPAGWEISDKAATVMRLSYENDLKTLLSGARGRLFDQMITESGAQDDDGEIKVYVPADGLLRGLFMLGQAATRVESLGMWTKNRVESTFHDDLLAILEDSSPFGNVIQNYIVPDVNQASSYPVDFYIPSNRDIPLYLFGVNSADRARISTIVIQHLIGSDHRFDSMVVCEDFDELPKIDGRRLMNAANDMVASISDVSDIKRKIEHRIS